MFRFSLFVLIWLKQTLFLLSRAAFFFSFLHLFKEAGQLGEKAD